MLKLTSQTSNAGAEERRRAGVVCCSNYIFKSQLSAHLKFGVRPPLTVYLTMSVRARGPEQGPHARPTAAVAMMEEEGRPSSGTTAGTARRAMAAAAMITPLASPLE